jgi:hypothetical protein
MNTPIATRILDAVEGDATLIQTLAAAIARNDSAGVRDALAVRGVAISAEELDDVVYAANSGAACTCTCTCT